MRALCALCALCCVVVVCCCVLVCVFRCVVCVALRVVACVRCACCVLGVLCALCVFTCVVCCRRRCVCRVLCCVVLFNVWRVLRVALAVRCCVLHCMRRVGMYACFVVCVALGVSRCVSLFFPVLLRVLSVLYCIGWYALSCALCLVVRVGLYVLSVCGCVCCVHRVVHYMFLGRCLFCVWCELRVAYVVRLVVYCVCRVGMYVWFAVCVLRCVCVVLCGVPCLCCVF